MHVTHLLKSSSVSPWCDGVKRRVQRTAEAVGEHTAQPGCCWAGGTMRNQPSSDLERGKTGLVGRGKYTDGHCVVGGMMQIGVRATYPSVPTHKARVDQLLVNKMPLHFLVTEWDDATSRGLVPHGRGVDLARGAHALFVGRWT